MIGAIYVEREVAEHPRTREILARFPAVPHIPIERYGEVFDREGQSFRLQKRRPSLILARPEGDPLRPVPEGLHIGSEHNFYFSHLLNCPYDCRYCFLQGRFRSAHYVLFVDYEAAAARLVEVATTFPYETTFFTGHECDSLALEAVTGFADHILGLFTDLPEATLELRTKSAHFAPLLSRQPIDNVVVAASLTPEAISAAVEHGVPPLAQRLQGLRQLADEGWRLGLRFEPLLYVDGYRELYRGLVESVFDVLDPLELHSVSFAPFRLPADHFRAIERLYPGEPLFAGPLESRGGTVSYTADREAELVAGVRQILGDYVDDDLLFPAP